MWTRKCAFHSDPQYAYVPKSYSMIFAYILIVVFSFAAISLPVKAYPAAPPVPGMETLVVGIEVNTEKKGEFFIVRSAELLFLIKLDDLHAIGFSSYQGNTVNIEGEQYVSLRLWQVLSTSLMRIHCLWK